MNLIKLNKLEQFILDVSKRIYALDDEGVKELLVKFSQLQSKIKDRDTNGLLGYFLRSVCVSFKVTNKYAITSELNETKALELLSVLDDRGDAALEEELLICLMIPVWFNAKTITALDLIRERLDNSKKNNLIPLDESNCDLDISKIFNREAVNAVYNCFVVDEDSKFLKRLNSVFQCNYDNYHPRTNVNGYPFMLLDHMETYASIVINGIINNIKIPMLQLQSDYKMIIPFAITFGTNNSLDAQSLNSYLDAHAVNEISKKRINVACIEILKEIDVVHLIQLAYFNNIKLHGRKSSISQCYVLNHEQLDRINDIDFNIIVKYLPLISKTVKLFNSNNIVISNNADEVFVPSEVFFEIDEKELSLFKDNVKLSNATIRKSDVKHIFSYHLSKDSLLVSDNKYLISDLFQHPITNKIIEIHNLVDVVDLKENITSMYNTCLTEVATMIKTQKYLMPISIANKLCSFHIVYDRYQNVFVLYKEIDNSYQYWISPWVYYDKLLLNNEYKMSVVAIKLNIEDVFNDIDFTFLVNNFVKDLPDYNTIKRNINNARNSLNINIPKKKMINDNSKMVNSDGDISKLLRYLSNLEKLNIEEFLANSGLNKLVKVSKNDKLDFSKSNNVRTRIYNALINYLVGGTKSTNYGIMELNQDYVEALNSIINVYKNNTYKEVIDKELIGKSIVVDQDKLEFFLSFKKKKFKEIKSFVLTLLKHNMVKHTSWSNQFNNVLLESNINSSNLTTDDAINLLSLVVPEDVIRQYSNDELSSIIYSILNVNMTFDDVDIKNFKFKDYSENSQDVTSFKDIIDNMKTIIFIFVDVFGINMVKEDFENLEVLSIVM